MSAAAAGDPVRVLLADDHTLFRQGLRQMLERWPEIEVVGEASNGAEAVDLATRLRPDVVLMDLNMPEMDGVEATRAISAQQPSVQVVVLTMYPQDEHAFEAVKAGARGYLVKTIDVQDLVRGLRSVHRGEVLVSAEIAMRVLEAFRQAPRTRSGRGAVDLTEREKDILRLLAEGATNKEIAARLSLAEKTVETRLSVVFQKLQINNRVQAALYALRVGLASLEEDGVAEGGGPMRSATPRASSARWERLGGRATERRTEDGGW